METFGQYIRKHRSSSSMTLTQLAAKLDMDSANLSKIENGRRNFDERKLDKLAMSLNLDIDKLRLEFYSDIIAQKIYFTKDFKDILLLAESKIGFYRQKATKQGSLNL